jgi:hypothetical protein
MTSGDERGAQGEGRGRAKLEREWAEDESGRHVERDQLESELSMGARERASAS